MEQIPNQIIDFLEQNRVATVSYNNENNSPQSFACFFAVCKEKPMLIFKSSHGTEHEDMTITSSEVSGTVLPEKLDLLKIKGIQFKGYTVSESQIEQALLNTYYNKYPFAHVKSGYVWAIRLESIKFTDNTLVFGHKTH